MRAALPDLPGMMPLVRPPRRVVWLRPRVVVALPDSTGAEVQDWLTGRGWSAYRAGSAAEVRRLMRLVNPEALVLPADGSDESGWLACAKLRKQRPGLHVVLIDGEPSGDRERFAAFAGATALVSSGPGLAERVAEALAPAARS